MDQQGNRHGNTDTLTQRTQHTMQCMFAFLVRGAGTLGNALCRTPNLIWDPSRINPFGSQPSWGLNLARELSRRLDSYVNLTHRSGNTLGGKSTCPGDLQVKNQKGPSGESRKGQA